MNKKNGHEFLRYLLLFGMALSDIPLFFILSHCMSGVPDGCPGVFRLLLWHWPLGIVGGMGALDSIYFSTVLEHAMVAERTTAVAAIGISRNS